MVRDLYKVVDQSTLVLHRVPFLASEQVRDITIKILEVTPEWIRVQAWYGDKLPFSDKDFVTMVSKDSSPREFEAFMTLHTAVRMLGDWYAG